MVTSKFPWKFENDFQSKRVRFRWFDNRSRDLHEIYRFKMVIRFDHISRVWNRKLIKSTNLENWESQLSKLLFILNFRHQHLEIWNFRKLLEIPVSCFFPNKDFEKLYCFEVFEFWISKFIENSFLYFGPKSIQIPFQHFRTKIHSNSKFIVLNVSKPWLCPRPILRTQWTEAPPSRRGTCLWPVG